MRVRLILPRFSQRNIHYNTAFGKPRENSLRWFNPHYPRRVQIRPAISHHRKGATKVSKFDIMLRTNVTTIDMVIKRQRQVRIMDYKDKATGADGSPYIWLRYTTQFSTGGRTHSIEMGIPVPVGASAEMREQLIREAESGMEQLTRHVESRVAQMMQRNTRLAEPAPRTPAASGYPATSAGTASPVSPAARSQNTTTPAESQAVAQEASHAQPAIPPARQTIGANMPFTPGIPGDANGNMKLGQFMQFIRETWGLTPKQAMDLLNVKSLNGLNYREVLRQLQPLVEQQASDQKPPAPGPNRPSEKSSNPGAPAHATSLRPVPPTQGSARVGQASGGASTHQGEANARQGGASAAPTAKAPVIPIHMVRDEARKYKFDEEADEEEMDELALAEADEEDDKEQRLAGARIKLDELKEVRGASAANAGRLAVLHNVLDSQIDNEQLTRLIQAAGGTTTVKKLKADQVEALISWAKEDYFVDEVEAVLDLIDEEEPYARSDR